MRERKKKNIYKTYMEVYRVSFVSNKKNRKIKSTNYPLQIHASAQSLTEQK